MTEPLPADAVKAAAMVLCEMAYPGSSNGWHRLGTADRQVWEDRARAVLAAAADVLRAQGAAAEREACAKLVISDAAVAAAAEASDEWFGKDGDLKCGASELSRAQARVELAVVADLIRARTTP